MSDNLSADYISDFIKAKLTPGLIDPLDELLDEIINEDITPLHIEAINAIMLTKQGLPRKRKRSNYTRGKKSPKKCN